MITGNAQTLNQRFVQTYAKEHKDHSTHRRCYMKNQRPWKAVLISVLLCMLWLPGCGQQEGPAEKAGKTIDQTMEKVGDTMEEAKENVVEGTKDLTDDVKDLTQKE